MVARPGIALALLSAVLFGVSTPLAKALLGQIDPWMLAGLLYAGSGLGLAVVHGARSLAQPRRGEAPLALRDLPWLAAIVAVGGVAGPVLLMLGLAATPASTAALLLNLEGLFTLAIAWVVFHENVDRRIVLGAAAILAGAVLLSWQGDVVAGAGWGVVAIAGACLAWAVDNNLTRKLSGSDPLPIAAVKGCAAGAVNITLAMLLGGALPPLPATVAAGVLGLVGYGISLVLFVLALRHLGTARTAAYFATAPFVGAVLAIAAFGEPVTPQIAAAAGLMAIGLWLHLAERHVHRHVHEPLRHAHRHIHDEHHRHGHGVDDPLGEPHSHAHSHASLVHEHPHTPDLHHRHSHRH